jgi:ferrous iron transport protein A
MGKTFLRSLDEIAPGQRAVIVALSGGREFQSRLTNMGLRVGQDVRLICGGNHETGPALIAAGETRLALGRGMARKILVADSPV